MKINNLTLLKNIFSENHVLFDPKDTAYYGRDWTTYFNIQASAVVFPTSSQQLVDLIRLSKEQGWKLVPSGGRTGLSGGAVATQDEIIVSFEKMNQILEYNETDRLLRVQSGVVTEVIQKFALSKNLYYPVDFAARGSSQIGGNIATNAGGIKVIRYGMTREWVKGLEVVTGAGDILKLNNGLVKNATGPSFLHHFIGSEGILGFITEALIQLTNPPPATQTLMLQVIDLESIMKIYQAFTQKLSLQAFEFFSEKALNRVCEHKNKISPFKQSSEYYVVLEVEKTNQDQEVAILQAFEIALENGWVLDGFIASSSEQAKEFWSFREEISESLAPKEPYKNDIAVRISEVPSFLIKVNDYISSHYPLWEVIWFGHIGDGNLHLNILKPSDLSKEEFFNKCQIVDEGLFKIVQSCGGAISAEHGVGLTKKPYLKYSRSEDEIKYLCQLKNIFDPQGILNPGKVIDSIS